MIRQLLFRRDSQRCTKAISEQVETLLSQPDWQSPVGSEGVISEVRYSVLTSLKDSPVNRIDVADQAELFALKFIIRDIKDKLATDHYTLYENLVTEEGSELRRLLRQVLRLAELRGYQVE